MITAIEEAVSQLIEESGFERRSPSKAAILVRHEEVKLQRYLRNLTIRVDL